MAWVWSQNKSELVDVVSIQLSAPIEKPTHLDPPTRESAQAERPAGPYVLIGICLNRQLHNLGLFSTKERAEKEMSRFGTWLRVDKGYGAYLIGKDKED